MSRNAHKEYSALNEQEQAAVRERAVLLTWLDIEDMYQEMLSSEYGAVSICGNDYDASDALKLVDPASYRCGLADYVGTDESIVELDCEYWVAESILDAIDELNS